LVSKYQISQVVQIFNQQGKKNRGKLLFADVAQGTGMGVSLPNGYTIDPLYLLTPKKENFPSKC
jgi:hypothetical protein